MRMIGIYKDKVALITGGGSGIGRCLCLELGREGSRVIVTDIALETAKEVAAEIKAAGGQAWAMWLDVSEVEAVQAVVKEIKQSFQRLDYIFNNAGIALAGEIRDMTYSQWQKMIDVNIWGVIYGSTEAYKLMTEQGYGHIVNIASVSGLVGAPITAAYATTKYAVVGYSTTLRAEAEALGVQVTVVCPAFVDTNMYQNVNVIKADRKRSLSLTPSRKLSPDKAARTILKGVARNKKYVVFPFSGRLVWWLYKMNPGLLEIYYRKMLRDFRLMRADYLKQQG